MAILPNLLAYLTKTKRYKPDIVWSSKSWTHNIFRFYELLFWRRVGIRHELSSSFDGRVVTYQAHSFEAVCALIEIYIRGLAKVRLPVKVWIPALSSNELTMPTTPFLFIVVAFDTSVAGADTTSTWTHVVTGSNPAIQVSVGDRNSALSAVTYAGSSLTLLESGLDPAGFETLYSYYLSNCATGSNTVALTTGSTNYRGCSASYSGVASGAADSHNNHGVTGTGTNTVSTTVVASNCWLIGAGLVDGSGTTLITSNRTDRQASKNFFTGIYALTISDSAGTVGTGSQSIVYTPGGASPFGSTAIAFSIAPFVPPAINGNFLTFM